MTLVKDWDVHTSPDTSLIEKKKPSYDHEGLKLQPGEAHVMKARIRGTQIGQGRVSARATIIDLRGRSKIIEAPCVLSIVEREGRLSTGSPIADGLLLGGLPRRSAALLTSPACDEKDSLVQRCCGIASRATVYASSEL